jgi:hypothetical protein
MERLRLVANTTQLDDEGASAGATTAVLLGSGDVAQVAQVATDRKWLTVAKTAWYKQREAERAHRKLLALTFVNKIMDVLGVDLGGHNLQTPVVELDGHRFTIMEYTYTLDEGNGREYSLLVGLRCGFCDRITDIEFTTAADLGRVLCERPGFCENCGKTLAASGTSAS